MGDNLKRRGEMEILTRMGGGCVGGYGVRCGGERMKSRPASEEPKLRLYTRTCDAL